MMDHLKQIGWNLANICVVLFRGRIDGSHLLMYSMVIFQLWSSFLGLMGVAWVFLCDISNLLSGWKLMGLEEIPKVVWDISLGFYVRMFGRRETIESLRTKLYL